jgi:hypothetical protein
MTCTITIVKGSNQQNDTQLSIFNIFANNLCVYIVVMFIPVLK